MKGIYVQRLLQEACPFLYVVNGQYATYAGLSDVYLDTMHKVLRYFPKGAVHVPMYLQKFCDIPMNASFDIVEQWGEYNLDADFMLVGPWGDNEDTYRFMHKLCQALHTLTDTKFNSEYFLMAWNTFKLTFTVGEYPNTKDDLIEFL